MISLYPYKGEATNTRFEIANNNEVRLFVSPQIISYTDSPFFPPETELKIPCASTTENSSYVFYTYSGDATSEYGWGSMIEYYGLSILPEQEALCLKRTVNKTNGFYWNCNWTTCFQNCLFPTFPVKTSYAMSSFDWRNWSVVDRNEETLTLLSPAFNNYYLGSHTATASLYPVYVSGEEAYLACDSNSAGYNHTTVTLYGAPSARNYAFTYRESKATREATLSDYSSGSCDNVVLNYRF